MTVFTAWHRNISRMDFIIRQSRSFEGICVPLRLMSCLVPVPDSQPTVTSNDVGTGRRIYGRAGTLVLGTWVPLAPYEHAPLTKSSYHAKFDRSW